jgi:hypothetical protein
MEVKLDGASEGFEVSRSLLGSETRETPLVVVCRCGGAHLACGRPVLLGTLA